MNDFLLTPKILPPSHKTIISPQNRVVCRAGDESLTLPTRELK